MDVLVFNCNIYKHIFLLSNMGLIRSGLVFILGVLLFISFLGMNTFAIMSSSLNYNNVENQVLPLVSGLGDPGSKISQAFGTGEFNLSQASDDALAQMQTLCNNTNITEYSFMYQGRNITISCDTLQQDPGAVLNSTISGFIKDVYYQQYDCGFLDCFNANELPLFLVSQKAHDYWKGKFWLFLVFSLVLIALMILFMENRINAPIIIGIILGVSAIIILKISWLFSVVLGEPVSLLIGIFFSKATMVFWISFILGLLLVALGFAMKFMNLGFMKNLINKKPETKGKTNSQPTNQSLKTKKKK